jgi:hypothetical protein
MKNVSLGVSLFGRKMTLIEEMRRRINIVRYFINSLFLQNKIL